MMHSPNRTFAAQIALGAVFGTALAWKTLRARQHEETSREAARAAMPARAGGERVARGAPPSAPGRDAPDTFSMFDLVPWPAIGMLILGTAAVIVVAVAFIIAVARNHEDSGQQVHVVPTVAATATAVPAPTPTLAEKLQDVRRQQDLASIRKSLDGYATFFGKYPSTGGAFQTLCAAPSDAGCTINRYSKNLPLSDGTQPYWYASDGRSFTLLAHVATAPDVDACPADVPDTVRDGPVYCVTGTLPSR